MNHMHSMKHRSVMPVAKKAQVPAGKTSRKQKGIASKHIKQSIPQALRSIRKAQSDIITYVLDTNVLMTAWEALFKFEEHEVVIVGQVWQELENHKKGYSPEAWNVRQTIRSVEGLLSNKTSEEMLAGIELTPPETLVNGKPHTGKLFFDYSQPEIPDGMNTCLDVNHPDDRIILICLKLQSEKKRVVLVSNDAGCRVKARISGLDAEEYLSDAVGSLKGEEDTYLGFHEMPADFWDDEGIECDENSVYTFKNPDLKGVFSNEFLVTGNSPPLQVTSSDQDGNVTARLPASWRHVRDMGVKPLNLEQDLALQLLLDREILMVSLAGKAGSGKTLLALAAGVYMVKNLGWYSRVLYVRSTQNSEEPLGFLPGEIKDKVDPWMGAVHDNMQNLQPRKGSDAENQSPIQTGPLTFMKGRSITDTLIVVDESEDLSSSTIKMLGTRVGEGSKLVLLGNVTQISNNHLTEHTSGLSVYLRNRAIKQSAITGHITLKSCVRSGLATLIGESM